MKLNWLFHLGVVLVFIFGIALYETNSISFGGKMGILIAVFFSPRFIYGLYKLWDRRENLFLLYENSKYQFSAIKKNRKK